MIDKVVKKTLRATKSLGKGVGKGLGKGVKKLRWGQNGAVNTDGTNDFNKGELQFGGFPNATRLEQTLGG